MADTRHNQIHRRWEEESTERSKRLDAVEAQSTESHHRSVNAERRVAGLEARMDKTDAKVDALAGKVNGGFEELRVEVAKLRTAVFGGGALILAVITIEKAVGLF